MRIFQVTMTGSAIELAPLLDADRRADLLLRTPAPEQWRERHAGWG